MANTENKTVTEIFGELLSRLNKLDFYHESIIYDEIPEINYTLIDDIGSQIYKYPPKEVLEVIDFAQKKIDKLIEEEEKIVSAVIVCDDKAGYLTTANDSQTELAKKQLYEDIRLQLMFFNIKLTNLKESLLINDSFETKKTLNVTTSISSEDLLLDIRQFALLFYYMREFKIIQSQVNDKLATFLSLLTGFSEQKIRTIKGLGAIPKIKSDKVVNKTKKGDSLNYNLVSVKNALELIIQQIEVDIKSESKK